MPNTRLSASRTTAKASTNKSSRVAPAARRWRNSTVFEANSWSVKDSIFPLSALIFFKILLTFRSWIF